MSPAVVMTTVNACHSKHLEAQELVYCLLHPAAAKSLPGHMSSFFGDVKPDLQLWFAHAHDISDDQLFSAARAFANYSGEVYPLAA
jgi:hypothetical protein